MAFTDDEKEKLKQYLQNISAPKTEPDLGDKALDVAHGVLDASDKYFMAPARAAVNHMQNVADKYQNAPLDEQLGDKVAGEMYGGAWDAAKNQFGQDDRSQVPSAKQILGRAGVPTIPISQSIPGADKIFIDPKEKNSPNASWLDQARPEKGGMLDVSPAGVAGFVADVKQDPTMQIPFGKIKNIMKGGEEAKNIPRTMTAEEQKAALEAAGLKPPTENPYTYIENSPSDIAGADRAAKKEQYARVKAMLDKRQKRRAKFLDEDTQVLDKAE